MIHHPVYFYGEATSMDLHKHSTLFSVQRMQRLQLIKISTPEHNRYGQFKKRITK
uniref:Uncharacterized protein n=1 Tax=Caenorhabditis elegans TaxID=6239 RepID=A0A8G2LF32_CAEEL